jgi:hypothetical protein
VAQSRLPEAVQLQVKRQERLIWLENWTGKNPSLAVGCWLLSWAKTAMRAYEANDERPRTHDYLL